MRSADTGIAQFYEFYSENLKVSIHVKSSGHQYTVEHRQLILNHRPQDIERSLKIHHCLPVGSLVS